MKRTSADRLAPKSKLLWQPIVKCLERLAGLHPLEKTYQRLPRSLNPERFLEEALRALQIDVLIHGDEISIPSKGPLLVVANHPFGGLEGLVAASVLLSVRKDLKIMANQLLSKIPEIASLIVGVNPFGKGESRKQNVRPTLQCLKWLRDGGALLVFPSGTVSHFQVRKRGITDPPWSSSVGRLVLRSRCSVLPIYFEGVNSFWFHFFGLFHPLLRTLLLPRELHNKRGRQVQMTIGPVFSFEELCHMESPEGITEYLRARTYALGLQPERNRRRKILRRFPLKVSQPRITWRVPIREKVPAADLEKDVANLPSPHCLCTGGSYRVYWANASLIPNVLREIGRLREIAFRAAGEGTGRSEDLDRFDLHYDHLFLWKSDSREVVGAYRIGRVDVILSRMGISGLYTASLFRYEQGLRPLLVQSLELGRSFVRPEYQKNYASLWFLWKGIGRYAAMHGTYRYLFGPVSISNAYHVFSRYLLYMYLREHCYDEEWGRWVRARRPWRLMQSVPWNVQLLCREVGDLGVFSEIITAIEKNERSVPILLRHYLKLGGKVLGFNVDPHFSNVLDALIVVDLARAEPSLLEKAMGRENARHWLSRYQDENQHLLPRCA